jgi:hypothetical protein
VSTIAFVVSGDAAAEAADKFKAAVAAFGSGLDVMVQQPGEVSADGRKAIDPIALASLIVSIPAFVLAVMDLKDRIEKRRRAQKLIDSAKRIQIEQKVEICLLVENVASPLDKVTPDLLIEIANK